MENTEQMHHHEKILRLVLPYLSEVVIGRDMACLGPYIKLMSCMSKEMPCRANINSVGEAGCRVIHAFGQG